MTSELLNLNLGPHNSQAIGPLRVKIRTEGETVVDVVPDLGYLHRGLEKIAEKTSWLGFLPYTDRIDYLGAIHCNLLYALTVEKLLKIEVPARANKIRLIAAELNRISSHLFALAYLAEKLGAGTASMFLRRDREKINDLFEMLCGARVTYSFIRIGGVAFDITEGFIEKTYEVLNYISPKLEEHRELFLENEVFIGRLKGLGVLYLEEALNAGITGPNLRALGSNFDLRKANPYAGYEKIQIPENYLSLYKLEGDALSRVYVRYGEILQSKEIILQALDTVPAGDYKVNLAKDMTVPEGEAYAAIESPRGVMGMYVSSAGGKSPSRLKIRPPSLQLLSVLKQVLFGTQLTDVSGVLCSLDIMVSEIDR